MSKSSACKLLFFLLPIFALSCNLWRANETVSPNPAPLAPTEIKSEIPFSTKEPLVYQTEILSQNFYMGGKTERKVFAARNGARRLTVFSAGEKGEISVLETDSNQIFSIYRERKIYAENLHASAETTTTDFLTAQSLNQKTPAAFEALDGADNLSKFRVKLGDAEPASSEILIYVDQDLKIPVRQEFYSLSGEEKTLIYAVEMKNFKLEAPENLFELPKDYRKVPPEEFQEIVWKDRIKDE